MQPASSRRYDPRQRLRDLLAGDACVTASSVFDPISARIADSLGFEVGVLGGSVASHTVLGAPDLILLTMTELVEQARRICRAGELSVIVDADHGYGNALNVMRTVEELQSAGVAGLTVEDTLLPRAFGSGKAPQLVTLPEGLGKMRAAVRARGSGAMLVFGRTSAASITGLDDAIERLRAYESAGVDALFVPGLKRREELDRIADAVRLPLVLGGISDALNDADYLASRGVRVTLRGHQPFAASVQALYAAMKAVREGTPAGRLEGLAPEALLTQLLRGDDYDAVARDFLDE
jgi:oxaloacetate decarboxylase